MIGGQDGSESATDAERIEALAYLVEALIIGQWARNSNPMLRARSDLRNAERRLEASPGDLSEGAHREITRILGGALHRLEAEIADSAQAN